MDQKWTPVPDELQNSYFFPSNEIFFEAQLLNQLSFDYPYMYDAAHYLNVQALKPWEQAEHSIPNLLTEWNNVKVTLHTLYQKRSKQVSEPTQKGMALFIQFLHWSNGIPVELSPAIAFEKMAIKPVNVEERLTYILSRPNVYHSYMQLLELMNELEKQYVKSIAIKQIKNR